MMMLEFGNKAAAAISAAKSAYDAALRARRLPTAADCAAAALSAVNGWNPIIKGRSPLTPAARDALATALGILAHNLRACESGGDDYPLI